MLIFARQSKQGPQPYVPIKTTHYPKYLDQFLTVLLKTFTTGLVFVRQSKQGATTLCFEPTHDFAYFPKKYMKSKEFRCPGGHASLMPPPLDSPMRYLG